jgi:hypothetical protein
LDLRKAESALPALVIVLVIVPVILLVVLLTAIKEDFLGICPGVLCRGNLLKKAVFPPLAVQGSLLRFRGIDTEVTRVVKHAATIVADMLLAGPEQFIDDLRRHPHVAT